MVIPTYYTAVLCNYLVTNCRDFSNEPDAINGTHGAVGNLYNWTAAIATNDSSSWSSSTSANISNSPQNSICPKGWRLPTISIEANGNTGNSSNEFARLNYIYNDGNNSNLKGPMGNNLPSGSDTKLLKTPLYFTRNGFLYIEGIGGPGNDTLYWSSTVSSDTIARIMFMRASTRINPEDVGYRYYGASIRCVAR